ncbi:ABC transporter substrate-binding protein [Pseudodonghicola sp. IC7]|uniref:ABC transporter substrate-binding protein n=1 Tax=Pseudodonghicola flavimaris TaxID=3050036 RepID=A0ABT7EZ05_9RHOB|nr:ABC transporter substrate-binding protein [Pseudodonghicola flavimaris]MDK3017586.1 ABC transporter substrate-binding protein [Pseudodonghicola flavimaris]
MRPSKLKTGLAALLICGAAAAGARAESASARPPAPMPPARVVSINLCTDQLALMLAAPGQLVSVSKLSHDPDSSSMAEAAQAYPTNGSGAEEAYLLAPDLVLAGTFTAPATVDMLRTLGIRVEQFAPANALADVPARLRQMGAALGREAEAEAMIRAFESDLAVLSRTPARRPRAALYYVNSYTVGDRTLAGDILRAGGFANVAAEAGLSRGGTLALEQLILLDPEVIIEGRDYPGQSRAEDVLHHPALRALTGARVAGTLTDRDWICGTPKVLSAVRKMRDLRLSLEAGE